MGRSRNGKPSTTDRLMARNAGLSRKTMADGGEVFQGALASRALKAVGARAMTMDGNIFVNEGFGGTPEDQALYAHEKVHEEGSGGHDHGDHNRGNDPEEMAARAHHLADAGDVVLVKGSKGSKVSLVVDALRRLGQPGATLGQGAD